MTIWEKEESTNYESRIKEKFFNSYVVRRKSKVTIWEKIDYLNNLLRTGKYPRDANFLGKDGGNFHQTTINTALALRNLKRRTKNNNKEWDFHAQRIDALVKIAKGAKTS